MVFWRLAVALLALGLSAGAWRTDMATAIDATRRTRKGPINGSYGAGIWVYGGKLFYVGVIREIEFEIPYYSVVVWALIDGAWTSYIGPEIGQGDDGGAGSSTVDGMSADMSGATLMIAYMGSLTPDREPPISPGPAPYIVFFNMDSCSYGSPILTFPGETWGALHSNLESVWVTDENDRCQIFATGAGSFILAQHDTLFSPNAIASIFTFQYSGGAWSGETWDYINYHGDPVTHQGTLHGRRSYLLSDLAVGGFSIGSEKHLLFVGGEGDLYEQILYGSGYNELATDLNIVPVAWLTTQDYVAGAVGKPGVRDNGDVMIPYQNSSGQLAIAKRISGSWSTEIVDDTKGVYTQRGDIAERDGGNCAAAYVLNDVWEVLWWDNANNQDSYSPPPAVATQTLWRSRYVTGAWTAPEAVVAADYWQRDVDVAVSGGAIYIIFQRYDSVWLSPFYEALGLLVILPEAIESTAAMGEYSGLTGGQPGGGDACGAGRALPAGGVGVRPGCSTYSAL
jgi:hypothetical protein